MNRKPDDIFLKNSCINRKCQPIGSIKTETGRHNTLFMPPIGRSRGKINIDSNQRR